MCVCVCERETDRQKYMVFNFSLGGFVADQMRYNLVSAQYIRKSFNRSKYVLVHVCNYLIVLTTTN